MLKHIKITNVGPAPVMELEFSERLNLITGDNGLGKSFFLDIAWWTLTRKWPAEINKNLTSGMMARPYEDEQASIEFSFTSKFKETVSYKSSFDRGAQAWTGKAGRPSNPGLVLYAQVDGSFAVWDPARNYWRKKGNIDVQDRPPAYVFSPPEVWDGLKAEERGMLCNGLIADWASWQKEKGLVFKLLCSVLKKLSPSDEEEIEPGELTRIKLDDVRDIPTLKMPYGQSVPVVHASAGIRRIIALAYLLVWSWKEHRQASKLLGQKTTSQIIFLIDEIEAHLHPKWQRKIISSLLLVMETLSERSMPGFFYTDRADIQIITATHSPLVLASVEPFFDSNTDTWYDLDFVTDNKGNFQVELSKRPFEKQGDASNWLVSEAFDLPSSRAIEYEKLLAEASNLLEKPDVDSAEIEAMHQRLLKALNPMDNFLFRWRAICEKKGFLK